MRIEARLTDALDAQLAPRGPGRLRVGLVIPQSGSLGMVGPSAVNASLLAAHELNVSDGVHGAYVDLVLVDAGRSPREVATEVGRLCAAEAVDVLVGFHTSDVHRAIETVVAGRTPYVFTPPHEGGRRGPGVLCIGTDPVHQLRLPIAWLSAHHSLRRWALIGNDYIWPQSVHRTATRLIGREGGRVVLDRLVPLGRARHHLDRLLDELRWSGADAVLLSLVGSDLAAFNSALRQADLDRHLVRLSGALEENGLLACDGDRTGLLYAAMSSFVSLPDERYQALAGRYASLFGPQAPLLDTYAAGVYDGLHLAAALAMGLPGAATGMGRPVHVARADGLEFAVVASGA